jgi:anti-sigma-K factor RskA
VAALLDVTSALSDSVSVDPPVALRAAVLSEIGRTVQHPEPADTADARTHATATLPRSVPTATPSPTALTPSSGSNDNVVPLRRSRAVWGSAVLAAASVLAAVAFAGFALQSRQDAQTATAQTDTLTQLLSANDVRTVPGVSKQDHHAGAIVMSKSEGTALFVASSLPALSSDRVYEAWTIVAGSAPVPAGTFNPKGSHSLLQLPDASFSADTMAITVEPAGGSDAPTSPAVVTFALNHT